jgi:hypothetical protein
MRNSAIILAVGGLLLMGSRCDRDRDGDTGGSMDGGVSEGEGSAGQSGGGEGEACGRVTCASGLECCNESCGICTRPGGVCTQQFCGDPGPQDPPETEPFCGGIAGFTCPGAGMCVDDPSDDCDPENGGADCGGLCVCNAMGLCIDGFVWNDSPEVCGCEPTGGGGGEGEACGNVTCPAGQTCCNESCGICVEPGGVCTEQFCGDGDPEPDPMGTPCGPAICTGDQECCNESCGICVEPGGFCTQQLCGDPDPNPDPAPFCGGFAGFPCPGAGECVDDPSDDCDPQNGGADCGGLCQCNVQGVCASPQVWNDSPEVCGCEASSGGEQCGNRTCPADQVCCNASCGICTPKGGACIQIACL